MTVTNKNIMEYLIKQRKAYKKNIKYTYTKNMDRIAKIYKILNKINES